MGLDGHWTVSPSLEIVGKFQLKLCDLPGVFIVETKIYPYSGIFYLSSFFLFWVGIFVWCIPLQSEVGNKAPLITAPDRCSVWEEIQLQLFLLTRHEICENIRPYPKIVFAEWQELITGNQVYSDA